MYLLPIARETSLNNAFEISQTAMCLCGVPPIQKSQAPIGRTTIPFGAEVVSCAVFCTPGPTMFLFQYLYNYAPRTCSTDTFCI